jgi:hypothetical protein
VFESLAVIMLVVVGSLFTVLYRMELNNRKKQAEEDAAHRAQGPQA